MLSACGKGGRCSLRGNLRRRRQEKEEMKERRKVDERVGVLLVYCTSLEDTYK